ncbi:MAG TPA: N-acetylmuramoyl-L-alanine amidase [Candidatus Polarisedimenticolia bacterium]|nr:N-acetylmuramoyl-L-alanine amidase [Candidatus Polarisedimenticolia bacterium]
MRYFRSGRAAAAVLPIVLALILASGMGAPPCLAQGQPLRFTVKTIENEAGVRVVLEFSRKPVYEVRRDARRVFITLNEGPVEPPFKKKDYGGAVLEKAKFIEGFRSSELVFYTGDDFGNFSTFEMGEPFRIVVDLRKKLGPSIAVTVPSPGSVPGAPHPPAGGGRPGAPATAPIAPPAARDVPPTEAPEAPPAEARPRAAFVVVIDPGHGGEDRGAVGPTGLAEKDVTLDIARRLKERILSRMDAEVILTRDSDTTMALDDRTAIANHNRADLFVCIHANASRRGNARGAETYFLSYQATDDDSRAVAALENNTLGLEAGVQKDGNLEMILWDLAQSAFLKESSVLAEIVQDNLNDALDIANRGIKQAPFRVLMGATMPAVLIEVAFITNPEEEKRLRDAAFKDRLSDAILGSIQRFHEKYVRARAR